MNDYEKVRSVFSFDVRTYCNFGFDQLDELVSDEHKIAYYEVNPDGQKTTAHTFLELSQTSNQFAIALLSAGLVGIGGLYFLYSAAVLCQ